MKKVLSILMCAMFVLGVFAPVTTFAANEPEGAVKEEQATVTTKMTEGKKDINIPKIEQPSGKSTKAAMPTLVHEVANGRQVLIVWTNTTANYEIYMNKNNLGYAREYTSIYTDSATGYKYAILNVDPTIAYNVYVKGYNSTSDFANSNVVSFQPKLTTPKISKITRKAKSVNITLGFTGSYGASGYRVYRAVKGGSYKYIGNISASGYGSFKNNVKRGGTYYYKLRAYYNSSATGKVAYSNYSAAKGIKYPKIAKPTKVKVSKKKKTSAKVSWKKSKEATYYRVYIKGGYYKKYTYAKYAKGSSVTMKYLKRRTTHRVYIVGYDNHGFKSGKTKVVKFKTK